MSADEKKILKSIGDAFSFFPDKPREFLMGYAEGVIASRPDRLCGASFDGLLEQEAQGGA